MPIINVNRFLFVLILLIDNIENKIVNPVTIVAKPGTQNTNKEKLAKQIAVMSNLL